MGTAGGEREQGPTAAATPPPFSHAHAARRKGPLFWTAALLVGLALVYLVGANLALHLAVRRAVNRDPLKLQVGWRWAVTPWPGAVYVRGLTLESTGRFQRWRLEVDAAWAQLDLLALREQRLHASWVRARGVELVASARGAGVEQPPPPPFPVGLPPLGVPPTVPPPPRAPPPEPRRWHVELERVHARGVRVVGLGEVVLRGPLRFTGALRLVPREEVEVGPGRLELDGGAVTLGGRELLQGVRGTLEAHLLPHRLGGPSLWQDLVGRLRVQGRLGTLEALGAPPQAGGGALLALSGGPAGLTLDLRLDRGRVLPHSRLEVLSDAARVALGPVRLEGPLTLEALAAELPGRTLTSVRLSLARAQVRVGAYGRTLFTASEVRAHGELGAVSLDDGVDGDDAWVELTLGESGPVPLSRLDALLPRAADLRFASGAATVGGRLLLRGAEGGVGEGEVHLRSGPFRALHRTLDLTGATLEASVRVRRASLGSGRLALDGSRVRMTGLRLSSDQARATGSASACELTVQRGVLDFPGPTLEADARVGLVPARPLLTLLGVRRALPDWAERTLDGQPLEASAHLSVSDERVQLPSLDGQVGPYAVRGRVLLAPGQRRAAVLVRRGMLSLGVDVQDERVHLKLLGAQGWFERGAPPAR